MKHIDAMNQKQIAAEVLRLNQEVGRLSANGDCERAFPVARKALALATEHLGTSHFETAASTNNLGLLYQMTGNLVAAALHLRKAALIMRRAVGESDPELWSSLDAL